MGRRLNDELGAIHISAGDLLRRVAEEDSRVSEILNQGHGVPPELSYGLLARELAEIGDDLAVLDAYPRRASEVERLAQTLGGEPDLAVLLEIPTVIAVERLLKRETCAECGATFGPGVPPPKPLMCGICGGRLERRGDDTPSGITQRHSTWAGERREITAHYEGKGLLAKLDASGPAATVIENVMAQIRNQRN